MKGSLVENSANRIDVRSAASGLRSEMQSDSERFALDPSTKWWAPTGTGIQDKTLASNLHFWTQHCPRSFKRTLALNGFK